MRNISLTISALVVLLFGGNALSWAQPAPQVILNGDPQEISGTIVKVDPDASAFTLRGHPDPGEDADTQATYYVDTETQIVKDDDSSDLKDLTKGERATVNYIVLPDGQAKAYFVLVKGKE